MAGSNALHPDHRIGVVQIGLGPIGQGIVRRVLDMPGVRLVGAVDPAPDKAGRRRAGAEARWRGEATLRRSNDVPGATAEQRAWRIERIELRPA